MAYIENLTASFKQALEDRKTEKRGEPLDESDAAAAFQKVAPGPARQIAEGRPDVDRTASSVGISSDQLEQARQDGLRAAEKESAGVVRVNAYLGGQR